MISDKAKANINDYAAKVLSLDGGLEALQEALRERGLTLLGEPDQKSVSEYAERVLDAPGGFETLKQSLGRKGVSLYNSVSRMRFPDPDPERFEAGQIGISTDTETCGNEAPESGNHHNVVQIGIVKFRYDAAGIIGLDGEPFERLRDPGVPITAEAISVHGLTDEMVRGHTVSDQEIADYLGDTDFSTAHNANFDRKLMERDFPQAGFDKMRWACSLEDVPWNRFGINERKLQLICMNLGFDYPAHGALNDSLALLHALYMTSDDQDQAFSVMERNSRKKRVMVLAKDIPFDKNKDGSCGNEFVKARGFRFSDENGRAGTTCWFKMYDNRQELLDDTPHIKRAYGGRDAFLPIRVLDGETLYSNRLPPEQKGGYRTAMPHATMGFNLLEGDDFVPPPLPVEEKDILLQF